MLRFPFFPSCLFQAYSNNFLLLLESFTEIVQPMGNNISRAPSQFQNHL